MYVFFDMQFLSEPFKLSALSALAREEKTDVSSRMLFLQRGKDAEHRFLVFIPVEPSDAKKHQRVFRKSERTPRFFAEAFLMCIPGYVNADAGNIFRAPRMQSARRKAGILAIDGDKNVGPPRAQAF